MKYRALKMVLSADDPNILYIEKHFSVNRDENVIDYVKNRVAAYEDSVLKCKRLRVYTLHNSKKSSNS